MHDANVKSSNEETLKQGMALLESKNTDEALEILQPFLENNPRSIEALHGVGMAQYLTRDYKGAIKNMSMAVALQPDNVVIVSNLAEAVRRDKDPEKALDLFRKAISIRNDYTMAHLGLANSLGDLDRFDEATAAFLEIFMRDPGFAPAYHYLGALLTKNDKPKEALPMLRKAVALRENYDEALVGLAMALEETENSDEALEIFNKLLSKDEDNASLHNTIGNLLKDHGRIEEAIAHFRIAIKADPDSMAAPMSLAQAQKGPTEESDLTALENFMEQSDLSREERRGLHFTIGKYHDDLDNYDEAFRHLSKGNDMDDREPPFDIEQARQSFNGIKNLFTPDFFAPRKGMGCESEVPVFILGMPRSGTTLLEQILASHPGAHGAGELRTVGDLSRSLSKGLPGRPNYAEAMQRMDPITACNLGDRYAQHLLGLSGNKARRVSDKMPGNFQSLGFIALILPRAKIIHSRRSPVSTCLSLYFKNFAKVISYSRDLRWLGQYYRLYHDLMDHWRKVLPMQVLDVDYEDTVNDHEGTVRSVLDFVGLEWNDACLEFHKTERRVKTASQWQVRQPIYDTSLERWRHYSHNLAPLFEALGDLAPKDVSEK